MPVPKTVVLSCAGRGSRLGFGHPKCLIDVHGAPLVAHSLRALGAVEDVRVVVGFQATRVIEVVRALRPDALFVFNHDYASTNALASLYRGSRHAHDLVLSLDGDLLVHPEDMAQALASDGEWLGVGEAITDEPVYAHTRRSDGREWVTAFSRTQRTAFEWTGLAQVRAERLEDSPGHVFQCLEKYLPLPALPVRSREVDTLDDYRALLEWSAPLFEGRP